MAAKRFYEIVPCLLQTVRPDWVKFHQLGKFLHDQFSPRQAVSTHGLFESFKSGLMWMLWAFKLIFDVDILIFFGHFFHKN
jgi:hypothetical protein